MDPNATLKVSAERLAELASVDPDATPGPGAALRHVGSVRPAAGTGPQSTRASVPSHSDAFARPSQRPFAGAGPIKKASTFGTVVLYVFIAVLVSAGVIALIALAGRLMQ